MTQDTAYEFAREELLIGPERIEKLRKSTVMVLGAGGVGSHCIEALARGGVGRLILVDADRVAPSNINRQSIAYHSTVGRYKTQVMKERIRDICPETEVLTYEIFVLPDNLEEIFTVRPDYIVDAIDTVTAKIGVIEKAKEMGVPVISCMGTGNKMHPELFEITDIHKTSVCPFMQGDAKGTEEPGDPRGKGAVFEGTARPGVRENAGQHLLCAACGRTSDRRRSDPRSDRMGRKVGNDGFI